MTQVFLNMAEPTKPYKGPTLLSAGHRPFFLMTAVSAVVLLALWLIALVGELPLSPYWHGHEMLYGFAGAAIGGFMMAAVPKWTNTESPIGWPLAGLVVLWLAGRIGMFIAEFGAGWDLFGLLDLFFLPVLGMVVAQMIMGAKNARNYVVVAIVVGLFICNLAYHLFDPATALHAGVFMVAALAALIGGRVVPAFTQNALRMHLGQEVSCTTPMWTHKAVLLLLFVLSGAQLVGAPDMVLGGLSAACAVVLLIRMLGWKSFKTGFDPIVWILHAAYVWLPIGFGLKAVSDLTGWVAPNAALHALTTGGIGLLILAVASRAALGHSGRALKVSRWTVLSYVLVIGAAILRVVAQTPELIMLSGGLWVAGYGIFALVYAPILLKPRIDGLPG